MAEVIEYDDIEVSQVVQPLAELRGVIASISERGPLKDSSKPRVNIAFNADYVEAVHNLGGHVGLRRMVIRIYFEQPFLAREGSPDVKRGPNQPTLFESVTPEALSEDGDTIAEGGSTADGATATPLATEDVAATEAFTTYEPKTPPLTAQEEAAADAAFHERLAALEEANEGAGQPPGTTNKRRGRKGA